MRGTMTLGPDAVLVGPGLGLVLSLRAEIADGRAVAGAGRPAHVALRHDISSPTVKYADGSEDSRM